MLHHAAPAYSLYGKKHTIDKLNDGHVDSSPGPLYQTSGLGIKTRSVSFTTGKSARTKINQGVLNNPSPTQYNNTKDQKGVSINFTRSKRIDQQTLNLNPQSTMYCPNFNVDKQSHPNYSLGTKYPSIMDDTGINPGPGYYEANINTSAASLNSKNSRFGTNKRFSQPNLKHPGVGNYNINLQKQKSTSRKGTIQKANRFTNLNDNPGPGTYNSTQKFKENIDKRVGKSLGKRLDGCFTSLSETKESFGKYFNDVKPDFRKTFSFGKLKRQLFKDQDVPGPSDYRPQKPRTDTAKAFMVTAKNVQYDSSIQNPGPGHYEAKQKDFTKYSFGKSKSMSYLNTNPGPGKYNQKEMAKTNYKACSVGNSKRTNFISKNHAGVGDYQILQKKTGGISIPRGSRFPKANENPGPGDYQFQSTISNFNFYKKRQTANTAQTTQTTTN